MVFYDGTGVRKQYIWAILIVALLLSSGFVAIAYAALTLAPISTAQSYEHLPGGAEQYSKTIALTFDDGPDPEHTPELLALLKEQEVPATFFLIGEHVLRYPATARMIVDDGFEIGNHTFTHSENVQSSAQRIHNELVATDRAVRDVTGRETKMFRPPYLEDVNVGEFDGGKLDGDEVRWAEEAGYIVVGANLDTQDWNVEKGQSDVILQRLSDRLTPDKPMVIIMHDAAGEGASIEALRTFIPEMKAAGYRFVFVSDYFGLSQSDVMPIAPQPTAMDGVLVSAAKAYVRSTAGFNMLVMFVSVVGIAYMWAIVALRKTYVPLLTRRGRKFLDRQPVSVIVPAYNEEANIEATVRSLMPGLRPRDEVLVVDDGSTDATAEIVRSLQEELGARLVLMQKENGGTKGAALSYAMPYAKYEHIVCIDADTIVATDAIDYLVSHFKDKKVGAVAGKIYPARVNSLLSTFQYLEYIQGQNLHKEVFALGNAVGIVPGAIGAWKKSAVMKAGGYSPDTVVEDQDLTMALLAHGYTVRFEPEAKAYTETPDTVHSFFRQRCRWVFGTFQCMWKYRTWLFSFRRPNLGWIILPTTLFFGMFVPILVPFIDGTLVMSIFGWADIRAIIGPFIIFTVFDIWCAVESVAYERRSFVRLIPLIFWQRFFYRYLIAAAIAKAYWTAFSGNLVGWGVQARRGECHFALDDVIGVPSPLQSAQIMSAQVVTATSGS
jgi:cellulose synthase/poly-beta-1,6-N-acetylglucosamine synthase-like glycosyltransferase/peptidoglycan/xylan/chitin deacetylase (PgdA/CDA1 family)